MLPDGPQALDDFLSGDPDRVYRAVREVMIGYDDEVLDFLAPHVGRIEAATKGIDLGGAIVPNRRYLAEAIRRLRAVAEGVCFCTLLPDRTLTGPRGEERAGLIEVERETVLREEYATLYRCRCKRCGSRWQVREETGWHMPTYQWVPVPGA